MGITKGSEKWMWLKMIQSRTMTYTTGWLSHPPPPNQQSLRPIRSGSHTHSLLSFDGLNDEAAGLIMPNITSLTGTTSEEGAKILAAFLALSYSDRGLVLDMEHEDLVLGFKSLIKKRPISYTLSPEHKRSRHWFCVTCRCNRYLCYLKIWI